MPASPQNEDKRAAMTALGVTTEMGGHSATCFSHSPLVIVSPGIPPTANILKELTISGLDIISDIELAYRETQTTYPQTTWVGVTGTNGKTTVTSLISHILEGNQLQAPVCGNIGTPILSILPKQPDVLVAELSSAQLTFSPTLKTKVAVFTNFTPDHLDWHGSLAAYKKAKLRLFTGDQSPEWVILNASDPVSQEIAEHTTASVFWFSLTPEDVKDKPHSITISNEKMIVYRHQTEEAESLFHTDELTLVGSHNQANALAAIAVALVLETPKALIAEHTKTFKNLEHRLEPVATLDGITYYNDSKATNVDACISALKALPQNVVLIAGGKDKGTPLDNFVTMAQEKAHHIVLIGEASQRFETALSEKGFASISTASSLEEAVELATQKASADYPVLFSPACASFGMFTNFEERGNAFKTLVQQRTLTLS